MKKILSIVSLSCILSGCSFHSVRRSLEDIESYIMDRPDSALVVLEDMDRELLVSKRDRAHHALLHAMALDKNFIDVSDDSLASTAVDYFSKYGPEKYEARSLYYLGLAYYYQEEYSKAILEFTKAEKVAEKSDSLYWGMTKAFQAHAYSGTHNHIEALHCLIDAYHIYNAVSIDYYIKVAEHDLAHAYYNLNQNKKAEEILDKLLLADDIDSYIKISSMVAYAFLKSNPSNADYCSAVDLYDRVFSEHGALFMAYEDFWAWAFALNQLGRKEESQRIVNQLMENDTSGTADYWMYLLHKSDGDFEAALRYLEASTDKIDKEVAEALQESLALTQRDYYASQSELSEYQVRNRTLLMICISVSALLAIGSVLWCSVSLVRRSREEKERYLKYADEARRQLEASKNEDYPALKRKYVELYRSKYEVLGSLYEQYSLYCGKKNAQQAIYDKVVSVIDEFKEDYNDKDLIEGMLDEGLDGIMSNLRSEMPQLKEKDYAIFRLLAIGFDVTTISHLMNTTMNSIYIRKSRIRQQLESESPKHKAQFQQILG